MSLALQSSEVLPPEAIALIREGTPKPRIGNPAPKVEPVQTEAPPANAVSETPLATQEAASEITPAANDSAPATQSSEAVEAAAKAARPKIQREREREPEPMLSNALVSVTYRVPADLPSSLVRASADRKAKRVRPFTQQEIVTEALTQWLKRNGY